MGKKLSKSTKVVIVVCVILFSILMGVGVYSFTNIQKNSPKDVVNYRKNQDNCNEVLNIIRYGDDEFSTSFKPIIYLYPTKKTNINVELKEPQNITCMYPKYENAWNVEANPNGDLKDLNSGRNLYSLYYECENKFDWQVVDEGFVVKGEDSAKFLEEKLEILGLNEREAEEFIIYWLPKLESNKYNYIRFATESEIEYNMGLEIEPKPDTLIRIVMEYKGLNDKIEVKEQKLNSVKRSGYTVVEWGGTELKD